jgi:uncharacterized membrane protein
MITEYFIYIYTDYVEITTFFLSQYIIGFICMYVGSLETDTEKVERKLVSHNTC